MRTPQAQGTCCIFTRAQKLAIHEPSIHEQDLSVSTQEIGNVSRQRDMRSAIVQNKCIDMENVHDVVDESPHPSWVGFLDEFGDLQEHNI